MQPQFASLLSCAHAIADAHHPARAEAGAALARMADARNVEVAQENGLRPIDILARGHDDEIAAAAVEALADAGCRIGAAPGPGDAAPLHAACYYGSWMMVRALLGYEDVDVHQASNGRSMGLLGSTAVHAVAKGYRAGRDEAYGNCLQLLLHDGADIDALDRMRKKPIDLALAGCVSTGDRSLVDALLKYGVRTSAEGSQNGQASALAVASAMSRNNQANGDLGASALKSLMVSVTRTGQKKLAAVGGAVAPAPARKVF